MPGALRPKVAASRHDFRAIRVSEGVRERSRAEPASAAGQERSTPNPTGVAEIPDTIVLRRHRDLEGRHKDVWVRRSLLTLVALIPILGLFNVFGQRPGKPTVATSASAGQRSIP